MRELNLNCRGPSSKLPPHGLVGFALQSVEDGAAGGEFHPGEPPPPPSLLPTPTCHGIMGDSDSVSTCLEFSVSTYVNE